MLFMLSIIYAECQYTECHNAECHLSFMPCVIYVEYAECPLYFMLGVIILSAVMLSVMAPFLELLSRSRNSYLVMFKK
jgi:hypothetical protein